MIKVLFICANFAYECDSCIEEPYLSYSKRKDGLHEFIQLPIYDVEKVN